MQAVITDSPAGNRVEALKFSLKRGGSDRGLILAGTETVPFCSALMISASPACVINILAAAIIHLPAQQPIP